MLGAFPSLKLFKLCSMHQIYSSSVSPFQAKTGTPTAAMAAAAESWVEKMLQEDQVTSAPRATKVSIRLNSNALVILYYVGLHGSLDGHVETADNPGALQGLRRAIFFAKSD